jgi:spore germination cell wall hydrolase CwlJ-like protein
MKLILTSLFLLLATSAFAMSEQETIAMVISAEAGGEGEKGLYAVACTISNRARAYHKTPYQVVTQKNQFYGLTTKNRMKLYKSVKTYADYLAKNIMQLRDITGGALYFRRPDEPMFRWCKTETFRFNNHIFYR